MLITALPPSTILVVDDNITNLKVAMEHLRVYGCDILTARSGEAGLERARLTQPDLVLLDVQLPGIDGFETCRRLKADPATSEIPVIFMTVLTQVDDKVKGFAAGAVDYVPKPFEIEELIARVSAHLTIYRLRRALQAEIREREQAQAALSAANLELERLAVLDGLTHVANRRRFDAYLAEQWTRCADTGLSLLMCDVDYFKRYNDGYGHQAGDGCLQAVAQGLQRAVSRTEDLVARYGGEEFALILPGTGAAGAERVAARIHAELKQLGLPHRYSEVAPQVTLSIGVACADNLRATTPAMLIAAADAALYAAKHAGRNRTAIGTLPELPR